MTRASVSRSLVQYITRARLKSRYLDPIEIERQTVTVSNLNDSGAGSFRAAAATEGPIEVVFSVSGTITITSPVLFYSDVIISGETAPSNGICIKGDKVQFYGKTHVKHMRFRAGYDGQNPITLDCVRAYAQVVLERCSLSWSRDELFSLNAHDVCNITFLGCIFSHALLDQYDSHAFAAFLKRERLGSAVFINCLFAHLNGRSPICYGGTVTLAGCVWYNSTTVYAVPDYEDLYVSMFSCTNVTGGGDVDDGLLLRKYTDRIWNVHAYLENCACRNITQGGDGIQNGSSEKEPHPDTLQWKGKVLQDPAAAMAYTLANVGALPLDTYDQQVILDVTAKTGSLIHDEDEVGGYPF